MEITKNSCKVAVHRQCNYATLLKTLQLLLQRLCNTFDISRMVTALGVQLTMQPFSNYKKNDMQLFQPDEASKVACIYMMVLLAELKLG